MSKVLVAYFSASGVTAKIAKEIAEVEQAVLFEIKPEMLYTAEDLNWRNEHSRSSVEMTDLNARPAISGSVEDFGQYDIIFVGFPIWWYREPSIVDTFLDSYDFTGKKVIPFCTSGGSGIAKATEHIRALLGSGVTVDDGKRLGGEVSEAELKFWADGTV